MNKIKNQPKILTQDELSKLTEDLKEYSRQADERSKKIKTLDHLRDDAEKFVEMASQDLNGEYSFYTVYENSNDNKIETYILIHSFYNEKDVAEDKVEKVMLEDMALLNQKLKETTLPIDYCFVMPYYDYIDGNSCLFNNLIGISIDEALKNKE